MHYVLLEALPRLDHPERGTVGGAYVTVFVDEPDSSIAEAKARLFVSDEGWDIFELQELREVVEEDFQPGEDKHHDFHQATIDGIVARFHRWPTDAPDA